MAFNFPSTPTLNQIYSPGLGLPSFQWNGTAWINLGSTLAADPFIYTATGGETSVTVTGGYLANMGIAVRNGAVQFPGDDVNITSGSAIVFTVPLIAGESILFYRFRAFSIADALQKSQNGLDVANIPSWRRNTMRRGVSVKSANYTVVLDDIGNVIANTGSVAWTLALPAAAAAGNGFCVTIRNVLGGATITIDPNGAETVNGRATIGVYGGDSVELICDGTSWHALFQSPFSIVASAITGTALSALNLTLPPEFQTFDLRLEGFEPSASATLGARLSINNGASYYFNTSAYFWQHGYDNGASGNSLLYSSNSSTTFATTGIELSSGAQAAATGVQTLIDIQIGPRGVSRFPGIKFTGCFGAGYSNRGHGNLGVSTGDLTNIQLLYSGSANIVAGVRYSLIGRR